MWSRPIAAILIIVAWPGRNDCSNLRASHGRSRVGRAGQACGRAGRRSDRDLRIREIAWDLAGLGAARVIVRPRRADEDRDTPCGCRGRELVNQRAAVGELRRDTELQGKEWQDPATTAKPCLPVGRARQVVEWAFSRNPTPPLLASPDRGPVHGDDGISHCSPGRRCEEGEPGAQKRGGGRPGKGR